MSAPALFREADLARALRAANKVGVPVRVEIEPGRMIVTTVKLGAPAGAMTVEEMFA